MNKLLFLLLLLPGTAFAQTTFAPVPADVEVDGVFLSGILVDEGTFAELGRLRVESRTFKFEIEGLEARQAALAGIWEMTETALRARHEEDMTAMQTHYSARLEDAYKRNFREKHGVEIGLGLGVVGTILGVLVTGYALGQIDSL